MFVASSFEGVVHLSACVERLDRTGWFPRDWVLDSTSYKNIVPSKQPARKWYYSSDEYGTYVSFPHWFLVLVTAALSIPLLLVSRFSLRTLIISMTLFAVVLGLVTYVARR
jgi:hypothetical protein